MTTAAPAPLTVDQVSYEQLAAMIDHSLLRPELTVAEVQAGCELAARYRVASVCVKPCDVALAARLLHGTGVAVGTVVGFPHGNSRTETKVFEARLALADGASELDMVINIGHLRSGLIGEVRAEVAAIVSAAKTGERQALVKVILENAYLSDEEKRAASVASAEAGADFVKTSTGFAPSGATLPDLMLMRSAVPASVQVKAAGGVRTLDGLLEVMGVGVTRIGATATAAILDDYRARTGGGAVAPVSAPQEGGY
ncbi:deoxyribose-phosphate aldolase [Deinococcus sp.]|uniref:deoxyribose-phosphate aldolase n=1 Tax=Deinococcus sp. TaxID=47478 RepID=UPI003CC54FE0